MVKFNLDPEPARLACFLSARDVNLLGHILIGIYATCTHRCWAHWEILRTICSSSFALCDKINRSQAPSTIRLTFWMTALLACYCVAISPNYSHLKIHFPVPYWTVSLPFPFINTFINPWSWIYLFLFDGHNFVQDNYLMKSDFVVSRGIRNV